MRPAFSRDPIVRLFQKWYLLIYLQHKIQGKISTLKRFFQGSLRYSKTQLGFYQTSSPNVFFKGTNAKMTALTIFSFLVWFKFRLSQLCSSFKIARAPSSVHPSLCVELHFSRRLFIGFAWITDYGRMMSRLQILYGQNHNPNPNRYSFKMPEKVSFL